MTDKATPTPSSSIYEKIERYGAYRFAHGHNEANQHYGIADQEKANAAALLAQICAEVERLAAQAAPTERDAKDAARYRLLRRGQKWSTVDGIGTVLRAETLDAAIDAAMTKD